MLDHRAPPKSGTPHRTGFTSPSRVVRLHAEQPVYPIPIIQEASASRRTDEFTC